jgi:hypothetical protein
MSGYTIYIYAYIISPCLLFPHQLQINYMYAYVAILRRELKERNSEKPARSNLTLVNNGYKGVMMGL